MLLNSAYSTALLSQMQQLQRINLVIKTCQRDLLPNLQSFWTLENPWMVPDHFIDKLQELWDKVMLDWPHWCDEDDHVYCLCMQKTYEWHTYIGKAGIEAVEVLLFQVRTGVISLQQEHLGGNEYSVSKSFLSPLVLWTFMSHIRDISVINNKTYHELIDYEMPRGALVLAVTSVKWALTLVSTGAKEVPIKQSKASFSDIGWGTKTLLYT
ncbi:hypothetical protein F5J12DRAFT_784857 [Pisolithus orientalis]|uniref:uncharacterized protein n=1 Tax=Pisolithus orientalis TaxID=936130 RepID=UPI0022252835|nr:uncharacterized protein F5J12DRAFT_784857 [Pisolithus orientalis]KAI5998518.1 hypothetical protein F5J12DRAFT_784857 [Pisolithus orientalis]